MARFLKSEAKPLAQARWNLVDQVTNIVSLCILRWSAADVALGDAGNTVMLDGAGETAADGAAAGAGCTTAGAGGGVAGAG